MVVAVVAARKWSAGAAGPRVRTTDGPGTSGSELTPDERALLDRELASAGDEPG
jgi:hypothetical protein